MLLFVQLSLIFCISTIPLSKGQAKECPPAEDVSPCTCEIILGPDNFGWNTLNVGGVFLYCMGAPIADVHRVMEKMQNLQIGSFRLEKYQSEEPIPADFFQGFTVKLIWIFESTFSFAPNSYPFEGLEDSLLALYMSKSQIGFPLISLGHLKNLKHLTIETVEVKTVESFWSDQHLPKDLEILMMGDCEITSMDRHSLTALHKLKVLMLPYNRLTNFGRNVLPNPLNDLHTLYLSGNQLTKLDKDFFEGMPSLRKVELSGNQILSMDWPTWEPVWNNLIALSLDDNPLDCERYDLRWICNVHVRMPKIISGSCVSPNKLQGVQIGSKEYCDLIG